MSDSSCPLPATTYPCVMMAHGGGGRLTEQLLDRIFRPAFDNPTLATRHDGAVLEPGTARLAFTTDSYVVRPLEFPGGDIGTLAVNGTVNDLAMCGARPRWLGAGFILEEGLPLDTLERIVRSMRDAAAAAGVELVTGDTKVVDKGKGDGLFLNTSGIGSLHHDLTIGPQSVRPGDIILLSGDVGRHGMAILSVREGLAFEDPILSDCAPVADPVLALLDAGLAVHCLRDLTRGGLSAALNEIASSSGLHLRVREQDIPVTAAVRGACEILGLDPLYVANEGRFIAFVAPEQADAALAVLRQHPVSAGATRIGEVQPDASRRGGHVTLTGTLGVERELDLLTGEQLPRIC